jgi:dihydrofolate reductase
MKLSVFVGVSLDGFMARLNGDFDFLPEGGGEPHGYNEFMATVDALVIGRNTFEKVLTFDTWPYGDKRVVVLSSRPVDLSAVRGGVVDHMAGTPAEVVSQLAATGAHHLYIDGGITIQEFLRAGTHSAADYHARSCAHWRGNSSLRRSAERCAAPSYRDSGLSQRPGPERIRDRRLT